MIVTIEAYDEELKKTFTVEFLCNVDISTPREFNFQAGWHPDNSLEIEIKEIIYNELPVTNKEIFNFLVDAHLEDVSDLVAKRLNRMQDEDPIDVDREE